MGGPMMRVMAYVPPPPSTRDKVKQALWGLLHVVQDDPKPAIYAVNPAGYGMLLFRTRTAEEADEKLERVGRELGALGLHAWCERYRVPLDFVEALEAPKQMTGVRRFRPML